MPRRALGPNVNAELLAHFVPGYERGDFVDVIRGSDWPE